MESWVQSLEMHALAMVVEDLEYIRPYVKKLGKKSNEVSSLGSCTWLLSVKCPAFFPLAFSIVFA